MAKISAAKSRPAMRKSVVLTAVLVAALPLVVATSTHAADPANDKAPALMPGVYELQEWHTDSAVLKPPQIYGRFVLMNGDVMTILRNTSDKDKQTTSAQLGHYTLHGTHYAYKYDNANSFTEAPSGTTARHEPWAEMRTFTVETTPDSVRLRGDGGQEFLFTKAGVTYSEKAGKPTRIYKRAAN